MKKAFPQASVVTLFAIFSLFIFYPAISWAQSCKPDYSKLDKIEKKQTDAWSCDLFETSFGHDLASSSQVNITFAIGRMGNSSFVQLQLQKQEESTAKTLIESSLKAVKGDEFYFGMKNGDPLKFVATEVKNQIKRNDLLGKWVTTVVLLSEVNDEDLPALKAALTSKIIDALRIKLENSVVVEQSVKEKKGNKMMEKAVCFFNFLKERGIAQSGKIPEAEKSKSQDKVDKNTKATAAAKTNTLNSKPNDNSLSKSKSEVSNDSEQFEGVWTAESKKKITLTITKINSTNYEVKQILKSGPMKRNISPCPTFELVNSELVCKEFKIIYLPEKSSIYFKGDEYKKE